MGKFAFGELKNGGIRICECGEVTLEDDMHWCTLYPLETWTEEKNGIVMLCWWVRQDEHHLIKMRTTLGIKKPWVSAGENEQSQGFFSNPQQGAQLRT